MPRQYQPSGRISPHCVSGERIITGHVRMNYLDIVFADQSCKLARALYVQRIPQRERRNILSRNSSEFIVQSSMSPQRDKDLVAAIDETVCKLRKMTLATAK